MAEGEREGVVIQRFTDTDAPAAAELETILFPGQEPWSAAQFRATIREGHIAAFAARSGEPLAGYAVLAAVGPADDPEFEVYNIAVDPEYQGRGIGRALLRTMLARADAVGAPVFLEVATGNVPARTLYEAHSFAVVGMRPNYYRPSGENAYTMARPPQSAADAVASAPTFSAVPARPDGSRIVLGIESSCDETGVAVACIHANGELELLADVVASSMDEHARFGGVVPEIASRAHLEALVPTVRAALEQAGIERPDAVAATIGPGLAGALLVGVAGAKGYAAAWDVPFYAVNHLVGHVAVAQFDGGPLRPSVALLVSGGHTQLLHVRSLAEPLVELGSTVDDAAGEAYDKVARLLGLGYPGGPVVDRAARAGNPQAIAFPRGMTGPRDAPYDFSFSGLKTAVARFIETTERAGDSVPLVDVAASFQEAVADVLTSKAVAACRATGVDSLLIGGGVAANSRLRELAAERCAEHGIELRIPRPRLCTDNGAMVVAAAGSLIVAGRAPSAIGVASDPGLDVETSQL